MRRNDKGPRVLKGEKVGGASRCVSFGRRVRSSNEQPIEPCILRWVRFKNVRTGDSLLDSTHREPTVRQLRRGVACTMGRRYIHLTCLLGVNGWCIAISLMLGQEDKMVLRDSLAKSLSIIRCCTKGPIDWRMANLAKCGCHIWLMTRNIRGLVLELEEGLWLSLRDENLSREVLHDLPFAYAFRDK